MLTSGWAVFVMPGLNQLTAGVVRLPDGTRGDCENPEIGCKSLSKPRRYGLGSFHTFSRISRFRMGEPNQHAGSLTNESRKVFLTDVFSGRCGDAADQGSRRRLKSTRSAGTIPGLRRKANCLPHSGT